MTTKKQMTVSGTKTSSRSAQQGSFAAKKQRVKQRIGILASGGDASGMNACVFYLAKQLIAAGFEPVFIKGGYDGLIKNKTLKCTLDELRAKIYDGGCLIGAGRSLLWRTESGIKAALKNYKSLRLNCVIAIGGNGTFAGMEEGINHGMNFIGIPATIDNDVYHTTFSLGFDSATDANNQYIHAILHSAHAMGVLPVVEIMGRECGKLALAAAIGSGADICAVAVRELTKTSDQLFNEIKALLKKKKNILVICQEKYLDLPELVKRINDELKTESRLYVPGYFQRAPHTSAFDQMLAAGFAAEATRLIKQKMSGFVVGRKAGKVFSCDLKTARAAAADFNLNIYNAIYN